MMSFAGNSGMEPKISSSPTWHLYKHAANTEIEDNQINGLRHPSGLRLAISKASVIQQ